MTPDDDQIETLLRRTGRRPPPPSDRAARVRAEVHAHWRAEANRRLRLRSGRGLAVLAVAASVVAAVGVGTWLTTRQTEPLASLGRIESVSGAPRLAPGDAFGAGSTFRTGPGGGIAARLATGQSLRLDKGTILHVIAGRSFRLETGTVYVDANPQLTAPGSSLAVATPQGIVREVGTQFEVRVADGSVRIRVREGEVSLTGGGGMLGVASGQQLDVDERGRVERREIAVFGNEWAWAAAIAPTMTIEGVSVRTFLDGMARERGLALQFEPEGLAASAATTTLSGSIAGMTPDDALSSVLPTCRMRHSIEGGVLLIEPMPPNRDPH